MLFLISGVVGTAMWEEQGRQFSPVASWKNNELRAVADFYPNKKLGLNGRHLIIGTNIVSNARTNIRKDKGNNWSNNSIVEKGPVVDPILDLLKFELFFIQHSNFNKKDMRKRQDCYHGFIYQHITLYLLAKEMTL